MSEVLDAVEGSPLLLTTVVITGTLVYAIERLGGLDGPMTRALRAWRDRELTKLRRAAMLRAEQRRIEAQERGDREAHLLARLRAAERERDDLLRQLDRARRRLAAATPTLALGLGLGLDPDDGPPTNPMRRESARLRPPGR